MERAHKIKLIWLAVLIAALVLLNILFFPRETPKMVLDVVTGKTTCTNIYGKEEVVKTFNDTSLQILGQRGFATDGQTVFYSCKPIVGADPQTFQVISYSISKDAHAVYREEKKMEGVEDFKTLVHIFEDFYKDSKNVYGADYGKFKKITEVVDPTTFASTSIYGVYRDQENIYLGGYGILYRAEGADPETFRTLFVSGCVERSCAIYYRDRNHVFLQTTIVSDDPDHFETIKMVEIEKYPGYVEPEVPSSPSVITRDSHHAYWAGNILPDISPKTVRHLGFLYIADEDSVVTFVQRKMEVIPGADPATFVPISPIFAKDSRNAYFDGKMILGADSVSFNAIDTRFAKDKYSVFYQGNKIEGAQPASFKVIDYYYSTDGVSVFFLGKKTEIQDPSTMQILTKGIHKSRSGYVKDSKGIYHNGKFMKDVDVETFYMYTYEFYEDYAKDKNRVYYRDVVIENADPITFVSAGQEDFSSYMKDQNNVYFNGQRMIGADPQSFISIDTYVAKDKNAVYFRGQKLVGVDPITVEYTTEPNNWQESSVVTDKNGKWRATLGKDGVVSVRKE